MPSPLTSDAVPFNTSHHHHRHVKFRSVKKLQDEYTFDEKADIIGSGAFSVVYRALRRSSSSFVSAESAMALPTPGVDEGKHDVVKAAESAPSSHQMQQHPGSSSKYYALKVISRSKVSSVEKRQQLREVDREVCVLQQLVHDGCTSFVEALQTSDEYCIVMALLDGCLDAGRYLKTYGQLSETHAAIVMFQLLTTVQYLHRSFRVLHRDIKLENVLLSPVPVSHPSDGVPGGAAVFLSDRTCCDEHHEHSEDKGGSRCNKSSDQAASGGGGVSHLVSGIEAAIARYGKATLVDFGLARWLSSSAATSSLPLEGHKTSDAGCGSVSPVSPTLPTPLPASLPSSPPVAASSDDDAGNVTVHLSCCGSEKYIPHEMLKWYVETKGEGSRKEMTFEQAMKIDVYALGVMAYVLLSGCFPYSGRTKATLATQQATVVLKMSSAHWNGVSAEAKHFVASLLATDVSRRCTIEDALAHDWIASGRILSEKLHLGRMSSQKHQRQQRQNASPSRATSPLPVGGAPAPHRAEAGGVAPSSGLRAGRVAPQASSPLSSRSSQENLCADSSESTSPTAESGKATGGVTAGSSFSQKSHNNNDVVATLGALSSPTVAGSAPFPVVAIGPAVVATHHDATLQYHSKSASI